MQDLASTDLVGLPDHELIHRAKLHRAVFCRRGLLLPSDTTVYHITEAQHFNNYLPFVGYYYPRGYTRAQFTQTFRDCKTLTQAARKEFPPGGPATPVYYVLQIEIDLLIAPIDDRHDPLAPVIHGGVNEMAITRIWIADRDATTGEILDCSPPMRSAAGIMNAFDKKLRQLEASRTAAAALGATARRQQEA